MPRGRDQQAQYDVAPWEYVGAVYNLRLKTRSGSGGASGGRSWTKYLVYRICKRKGEELDKILSL